MSEVSMIMSDPFVDDLATAADQAASGDSGSTQNFVRRPYYGVLHTEEYFAYLSVKSVMNGTSEPSAPKYISLLDSSTSNGTSQHNHNFMLTQIDIALQEKAQVIQTFGSDYAFFFGQQPMIISCAGFLLNSRDFNWKSEWLFNYQNYLRGTACVKSKSRVYLGFKSHIAVGYLTSTNLSINASQENAMGFNFTMLLTSFVDYSRFQKRSITSGDDTGFTVNSATGGREVEYVGNKEGRGAPAEKGPKISYVDFLNFTVAETENADDIMPSVDMLNSTWWLPGEKPLEAKDAFQELAILEYMEKNGVSREEALLAGLQGKLLSSDPSNLRSVRTVFDRNVENGIIVK